MIRFLIVPQVTAEPGQGPPGALVAKYLHGVVAYTALTYGRDTTLLVGADLTPEQHAAIAENSDVIAIPVALDNSISAQALPIVQNALEDLRIPALWVTTAHTYREVVGIVGRIFALLRYFQGLFHRTFWEAGITLETRMNQLTAPQRQALIDAAAHFGVDGSSVTGPTTVRQVLKLFADGMPGFTLEGEVF